MLRSPSAANGYARALATDTCAGPARRAGPRPRGSAGRGGSGDARRGSCATRAMRARHGLRWSSGVGSSHRSRNVLDRSPTAGPRISTWMSCHGGRSPYFGPMSMACGSPWWRSSSRRPWHRSMPPTKATSSCSCAGMAHEHQLLVVRPGPPHPLVQQHLAAGLVHHLGEVDRLLLAEVRLVRVRPPHEAPHVDAPLDEVDEHGRQLAPRVPSRRSSPSPRQSVSSTRSPALQALPRLEQAAEVLGAVHQRPDLVALGPPDAVVPVARRRRCRCRGFPARLRSGTSARRHRPVGPCHRHARSGACSHLAAPPRFTASGEGADGTR